jgi:hypothetical protein
MSLLGHSKVKWPRRPSFLRHLSSWLTWACPAFFGGPYQMTVKLGLLISTDTPMGHLEMKLHELFFFIKMRVNSPAIVAKWFLVNWFMCSNQTFVFIAIFSMFAYGNNLSLGTRTCTLLMWLCFVFVLATKPRTSCMLGNVLYHWDISPNLFVWFYYWMLTKVHSLD